MSCSDDDLFDLSQFVGYNQIHPIRVIKEVRAIIASTVDETTPQRSNIAEKRNSRSAKPVSCRSKFQVFSWQRK